MDLDQRIKIAVLVSGGGSNLQAILDAQASGALAHAEVSLVISSKEAVYALTRAAQFNIPSLIARGHDREKKMLDAIRHKNIDLIVLAGYLSILSADFLEAVQVPVINVHPSLLPKYGGKGFYGLRVHRAVLDAGESITGATVHYVNAIPDGGAIIRQKQVQVRRSDSPEDLQQRVMEEAEWQILPEVCEALAIEILQKREVQSC